MAGERGLDSEIQSEAKTLKKLKEQGYESLTLEERKSVDADIDTLRNHPDFRDPNEVLAENGELFQSAYHGTPHNVDRFSTDKIGTGEGAQAYGHGLYFADSKKVAEFYKESLKSYNIDGKKVASSSLTDAERSAIDGIAMHGYDTMVLSTKNNLALLKRTPIDNERLIEKVEKVIDSLEKFKGVSVKNASGNLYKVELKPEEHEYLLWDKHLSEQSDYVRKALGLNEDAVSFAKEMTDKYGHIVSMLKRGTEQEKIKWKELTENGTKAHIITEGSNFYTSLSGLDRSKQKEASEYLSSLGIKGIKYFDAPSRANKNGEFNYVIFNDKDVEIKGANGKHYDQTVPDELFQKNDNIKGSYNIDERLIKLFESHDVSTLNHELGHRFLFTLDAKEKGIAEQVFGVKDGKWRIKSNLRKVY